MTFLLPPGIKGLNLICFCITVVAWRDIIVNNYDTSLVSGMYILNDVCYLATIRAIYFFYNSVITSREHFKRFIYQEHCVYFTTLVATIDIITTGLWLIREKLNDIFIWGKPLYPHSFKASYLFHWISCSNNCLKSTLLNAQKYLQLPHCLLVNVLIYNFTTIIAAIH